MSNTIHGVGYPGVAGQMKPGTRVSRKDKTAPWATGNVGNRLSGQIRHRPPAPHPSRRVQEAMARRRHTAAYCPAVWPYSLVPLGERALTIDLSGVDASSARALVESLDARIRDDATPGVTGRVPAIRAYTVHYEPMQLSSDALQAYIASVMASLMIGTTPPRVPIVIPVCYGGEFGPDLDVVANTHRITPHAIVAAHTAGEYTVAMIGFLPGFPYLEGLAPALHTPRRAAPRTSVPAGSVGIGGTSTGIYPCSSPGGWQLIGRTPRTLFSAHRTPPALLAPGDVVRFVAIAAEEWATHRDSS